MAVQTGREAIGKLKQHGQEVVAGKANEKVSVNKDEGVNATDERQAMEKKGIGEALSCVWYRHQYVCCVMCLLPSSVTLPNLNLIVISPGQEPELRFHFFIFRQLLLPFLTLLLLPSPHTHTMPHDSSQAAASKPATALC